MLKELTKSEYRHHFPGASHPYIQENFINLIEGKRCEVIRLMQDNDNSLGLVVGVCGQTIRSPFSAPFGGFHYSHEQIFYNTIADFIESLKIYLKDKGFKSIHITLPPDIYQTNMNSKTIHNLICAGFSIDATDITNWIDLKQWDGNWVYNKVAQNCRKAMRNGLKLVRANNADEMQEAYAIVAQNRTENGREIHMAYEDVEQVSQIMPVDYFLIRDENNASHAAGIYYRGTPKIIQGIFFGDKLESRALGAMDLLYMGVFDFYKELGYDFIDMGTSSMDGAPNIGLVRFKETHNSSTSLRYTFKWTNDNVS